MQFGAEQVCCAMLANNSSLHTPVQNLFLLAMHCAQEAKTRPQLGLAAKSAAAMTWMQRRSLSFPSAARSN